MLNLPVESIPSQNSWAYDQIVQGIADGKIKGLWVIATNAAQVIPGFVQCKTPCHWTGSPS